MIRNASRMWGYRDAQDINSFDPVLGLIFGAVADELHQISSEINQTEGRIVEKLLELIYSQHIYSHFPAHAIAHAAPTSASVLINENYRFFYSKHIYNQENKELEDKKKIFFTPTQEHKLINSKLKYLLTHKHLYETEGQYKDIVADIPTTGSTNQSSVFLGLQVSPSVQELDGLSFYFSFKSLRSDAFFFQALSAAKWKINQKQVSFNNGFYSAGNDKDESIQDYANRSNNISTNCCNHVKELYQRKFMTLDDIGFKRETFTSGNFCPVSKSILDNYNDMDLEDIVWIEIQFSQPLGKELINDLSITSNCFPVINRELNEITHMATNGHTVIPLFTDDLFFDIKKVSDTSNVEYLSKSSLNNSSQPSYIIRQGGVGRFDSRDVNEIIKDLIIQTKNEAAAFAVLGGDLLTNELKQLNQIISRINKRLVDTSNNSDKNSYLVFDAGLKNERLSVEYWSIAGEIANNIKPGSKLSLDKGFDVDDNSIMLVSQTAGGRQKLSREDKINTLRRDLLSGGKVVTKGDIKALCREIFSNSLENIRIEKGVSMDSSPHKGYCRTLDIRLSLKEESGRTISEYKHMAEELVLRLRNESMNLLPYRIYIDDTLIGQTI